MKRIGLFLGLTFFMSWSMEFYVMAMGGISSDTYIPMQMMVLLMPAFAAIITRISTQEGFRDSLIKPRILGHVLTYILAWFTPQVLIFAGTCLYYALSGNHFDINMTAFAQTLAQKAQTAQINQEITPDFIQTAAYSQVFTGIFLAPLFNIIYGFGQEFGWRGYLLPKLTEKFSVRISVLINGTIWGIWYVPLIIMGYTYGTNYTFFPYLGIFAIILYCILFGAFLSYLTLKSKSVIPASIANGGMSGFASIGLIYFMGDKTPFLGPEPYGLLGGIGVLIVGILCFFVIDRYHLKEELPKKKSNKKLR